MPRSEPLASGPRTAPEVAAPAVPQAVLSGIVLRRDSQQNLAILAIGEEAPNLVKPGDRVSEHWTVASVGGARLVLVAHSGHMHTVVLGSNAIQAEVQAPVAPVAPQPAPPVMRMPDQHMIEMAEREFNLPEND
ncbi:hypothetical protein [Hydrogenophaga sp.]|uniref:hypothetical protein n=1 Tax=Hydrogenophaga sp. TaxID=1904254 RepID=UPI0027213CB6|nr:hypothetical protein [Hydrogenophaga sp.]MDO9434841.1 hypothetical protein [Hydrogenophaga sp.]